ncbi:MAG: sugar phosphate isomerase/epimerase [Planctomycetia bacterium]|nr:sugar phosphate isomerase/epimerase [Planctomycetia bacterium]
MKNLNRRDLLKWGLGASAIAFAPKHLFADAAKKPPIALQLYSIREECKKDLPKMLQAVKTMGYDGVELMAGNFGADAKEFRKMLDDNGLVCCGTHTPSDSLQDDNLPKIAEYMGITGGRNLIVPWLDGKTKADWLKHAAWLSERSEAAKKLGVAVGFHNHCHEMTKRFDGVCAWDLIFSNTPKEVIHQIDLGHCVTAGADPVPFIQKYAGRSKTVHVAEAGGGGIIGKGDVKWGEVLSALYQYGGTEWLVIECENKETPVADSAACFKGLKALM